MLGLNLANRSAHTTNALIELLAVSVVAASPLLHLVTYLFVDKMAAKCGKFVACPYFILSRIANIYAQQNMPK